MPKKNPYVVRPHYYRESVSVETTEPSMTVQSFKDSCDINNIMKKYQRTGVIDHINVYEPQYGDVDGATFTEAMQTVANATTMFMDLPGRVREAFDHDPAKFLDYVDQKEPGIEHRQMLYDLGLTDLLERPVGQAESDDLSGRQATKTQLQAANTPPADPAPQPDGDSE